MADEEAMGKNAARARGALRAGSCACTTWKRRCGEQRGFLLIEVMVTAVIVAAIAAMLAVVLIEAAHGSGVQRVRAQASEVAQQDQDRLRGFSALQLQALASSPQSRTVTLDSYTFTVVSSAKFVSQTGSAACLAGSGAYWQVDSNVNWSSNTGAAIVADSIVTPPASGTLLVKTVDQTGTALPGVNVTATGPDYGSGTTDASGCVTFAGLETGSFSLSTTKPGYVDPNGNASPPGLGATVSGSGTSYPTSTPVMLGLAGNLSAVFTTQATGGSVSCPPSNGLCTGQQSDYLSWLGSGSSTTMSQPGRSGTGTLASTLPASGTVPLFPFYSTTNGYNSNYQAWAGGCVQMQPPSGVNTLSAAPGSSLTGTPVREPALNVVVDDGNAPPPAPPGTPLQIAPAHLRLTFVSTSGPPCSDSWYAAVAGDAATDVNGALAYPGQPFASTATSGPAESASTYTGQYTVCADYNSHFATATTQNNNFTTPTPVKINIGPQGGTC
jgi:Tfp pilus assembly protein PilE